MMIGMDSLELEAMAGGQPPAGRLKQAAKMKRARKGRPAAAEPALATLPKKLKLQVTEPDASTNAKKVVAAKASTKFMAAPVAAKGKQKGRSTKSAWGRIPLCEHEWWKQPVVEVRMVHASTE
eukprot:4754662-Pyramimonas_sp.AAC.1